jgi:hypothetical protein
MSITVMVPEVDLQGSSSYYKSVGPRVTLYRK